MSLGCRRQTGPVAGPPVELQVLGESTRLRTGDTVSMTSLWYDGTRVALPAARGEILGLQVIHRIGEPVSIRFPDDTAGARVAVRGYTVDYLEVVRPSTTMYGGSHGAGRYAEGLTPAAATPIVSDPAYFELEVARGAPAGVVNGQLTVGSRTVPIALTIAPVTIPPLPLRVWAYGDMRELRWAKADEQDCIAMFRRHGVLLSPDIHLEDWPNRKAQMTGVRDLPVWLPDDPDKAALHVKGWLAAVAGTEHIPFAIPIDEPRRPEQRERVRVLAQAVRDAGGGPTTFRYAVTDEPRPEYGDLVDLYISPHAVHLVGDHYARWTYNGAPPYAGSMVLDAEEPGMRTWGWIAWRWQVPIWYVWDALYWHDRHNRKSTPMERRKLELADPISFDDGGDRGNLDGVLALPGCKPTLRMAALRRGYQDFSLLEQASACDKDKAAEVALEMVPLALADSHRVQSWSSDEADWEAARRKLIEIAASCVK